jgi:hypothetical protein
MAALHGQAPKVRNANRGKGYWVALAKARANRPGRVLVLRDVRSSVNYPSLNDAGSAAYRRSLTKRR